MMSIFFLFALAGQHETIHSMTKRRNIIELIDSSTEAELFRTGEFARRKGVRQSIDIVRAKTRRRTAAWRMRNDRVQRPEASVVAMALLRALVSSPALGRLTEDEHGIVAAALIDLHSCGYSIREVLAVCKRLRKRTREEKTSRPGKP
jgi:hypothetical protein